MIAIIRIPAGVLSHPHHGSPRREIVKAAPTFREHKKLIDDRQTGQYRNDHDEQQRKEQCADADELPERRSDGRADSRGASAAVAPRRWLPDAFLRRLFKCPSGNVRSYTNSEPGALDDAC